MITKDSVVVGVGADISKANFSQVLKDAGSPAYGEASACYDAVVKEGVSPAFALAIFKKESQYATDPKSEVFKFKNNNPGNCRSSTIGPMPLITTDRGIFVKYPDWTTGFRDLAHRLVAPDYVYSQEKRVTVAQIINRFAPASDSNDPAGYTVTVVTLMNQWIAREGSNNPMSVPIPTQTDIKFPVQTLWAADTGPVRTLTEIVWGIVHDTQGGLAGDKQVLSSPLDPVESCHALIAKDGTTYFMVPLTFTAWTPGNDAVARKSINVEMSGFASDGYTDQQYIAMANFFAWCIKQGANIPVVYASKSGAPGFIGHEDVPNPDYPTSPIQWGGVSGHTDPGSKFDWPRFINLLHSAVILGGTNFVDATKSNPDVLFIKETGKQVGFGFKDAWLNYDKLGTDYRLITLGYPITNEFDVVFSADTATGKKHTVQLFQRGGLIHEGENAAPWDNHPMLIDQLFEARAFAVANKLI